MSRLTMRDEHSGMNVLVLEEERLLTSKGFIEKDEMYKIMMHLAEKLADYEDKQEQGLLLELPVRIGEVIYSVECGEIVSDSLYSVNKDNKGLWAINQYGLIIGRFGHTVFATRSEAEEALAKMGGK